VKGLLYAAAAAAREGLESRESALDSPVTGPIEKILRPFEVPALDSAEMLVGLVEICPDEPGLDMDWFVEELGGDVREISGPASESTSSFCKGAPFVGPSAADSRDPDAEGVSGGVCIADARGLARGDGLPDDSWVCCRLVS